MKLISDMLQCGLPVNLSIRAFLDRQPVISSDLGEEDEEEEDDEDDERPLDEDLLMSSHGVVRLGGPRCGVCGQTQSPFRGPLTTSVPET